MLDKKTIQVHKVQPRFFLIFISSLLFNLTCTSILALIGVLAFQVTQDFNNYPIYVIIISIFISFSNTLRFNTRSEKKPETKIFFTTLKESLRDAFLLGIIGGMITCSINWLVEPIVILQGRSYVGLFIYDFKNFMLRYFFIMFFYNIIVNYFQTVQIFPDTLKNDCLIRLSVLILPLLIMFGILSLTPEYWEEKGLSPLYGLYTSLFIVYPLILMKMVGVKLSINKTALFFENKKFK